MTAQDVVDRCGLIATVWAPGRRPEQIALGATVEHPVWIELERADVAPAALANALRGVCGDGLTDAMVHDLLDRDTLPEVRQYDGSIRKTSSFGIREAADGTGLVVESVEFLSGDRWLIACWQGCQVHRAGRAAVDQIGVELRTAIGRTVADRWAAGEGAVVGDLGLLVLHELALRYANARSAMWSWLESWESEFYARASDPRVILDAQPELDALSGLHRLSGEFRRRLAGLNVPNERAHLEWFAATTLHDVAARVDGIVDRSLDDLRGFSDSLRQSVGLTQTYATARHLMLAENQQKSSERLQRKFELVTAVLLVPTLVAGVFGANTRVPGQKNWEGFEGMIALMIVGALITLLVIDPKRVWRFVERGRDALSVRAREGNPDSLTSLVADIATGDA